MMVTLKRKFLVAQANLQIPKPSQHMNGCKEAPATYERAPKNSGHSFWP